MPLLLLDPLVDVILVLALALCAKQIVNALFSPLTHIKYIGGAIAGVLDAATSTVQQACYSILRPFDKAVGKSLHAMARLIDSGALVFKDTAKAVFDTAELLGAAVVSIHGLRNLISHVRGLTASVGSTVKTLSRGYHALVNRVTNLEKALAHGIGHGVVERLKRLEKTVYHSVDKRLDTLESEVTAIPQDITNYLQGIGLDISKADTIAFAGAVAAALSYLGLGGLRCNSLLRSLGNRGCGLWSGLEDVLALFVDAVIFVDLCKIIPAATGLFSEFEAPLTELISGAANAACAQIPTDWAVPMVAAGPLPPPQTLGPLAQS